MRAPRRAIARARIGRGRHRLDFGRVDPRMAVRHDFCERYPGRSGWIAGRSYGASPATVSDSSSSASVGYGDSRGGHEYAIPLRRRCCCCTTSSFGHVPRSPTGPVVLVAALLAISAEHGSVLSLYRVGPRCGLLVWLYWEGVKSNALSSKDPRRQWWEPLCLRVLTPLFSIWETVAIFRALVRVLSRGEPSSQ